jgi:dTDP-4-amino-4,6-dideoxygalactose transaminase
MPADARVSRIPFNRPFVAGREFEYIQQAINAMHLSGDGTFTRRAHEHLLRMTGGGTALLTTSCTHALEMMALLLDLRPGDEVIMPSFTFVSTANAFALRGATPVFGDIRPDTLNLDERQLERLITPRTRAIVVVHYAGVGCEMDAINAVAAQYGIPVLEDNAHGLLGRYRGRRLGSFGVLAAQSFHETKNFSCGEGGALIVNEPAYRQRAEILREKGTNRTQFFQGLVDKYTWVDIGSSYLPSEILAAFLVAQLEDAERIVARRQSSWDVYRRELQGWAERSGVRLPFVPSHCEQAFHMFYLVMPSNASRTRLIAALKDEDIHATFHYVPLHLSPMGQRFGGRHGDCPVAESVSECLVRLPFFTGLTEPAQQRVIETVTRLV